MFRTLLLAIPHALLLACDQSDSQRAPNSNTGQQSVMISLLQCLPDGRLVPVEGIVSPSLPCPQIDISEFEVTNLRKNPEDEYGYICDITVSGSVESSLCDVIPGANGAIEEIRFFHNDGDNPVGVYPVDGTKGTNGRLPRSFPFEGSFRFTAEGISVTEGNNTFRIVSRDTVYGLDGHSLWAASFAFPYEDEYESDDEDAVKEPTVVEAPQIIGGGSVGELSLYCFALANDSTSAANTRMIVDSGSAFEFTTISGSEYLVPVWPETGSPALFTLRPTMAIQEKAPSDTKVISALNTHPSLASLSPESRFRYGFSQGLGFEGYDLVFDSDHLVQGELRLSKSLRTLEFSIELADASSKSLRGRAEIGADLSDLIASDSQSSMPNMMWYFANLFRTSDPRADELVLALLIGNLDEVGLEDVSIADWREYFYMCFSEVMEELIKKTVTESEVGQGYYLGRALGDALRTNVDPTLPGRLDEIGKAEFLSKLTKMPCFNPKGRGRMAIKKQAGLIDGLRRFIAKNG